MTRRVQTRCKRNVSERNIRPECSVRQKDTTYVTQSNIPISRPYVVVHRATNLKISGKSVEASENSDVFNCPSGTSSSSKLHSNQFAENTPLPLNKPKGQILEAPTYYPTELEFQDPLEYIEKIRATAEIFGICRVVPPSSFKPECKVIDGMRFTAYNQYVHKMLHRWGPNVKEIMALKKYLSTQNISLTHPPWVS